jgi:hypothetical protein
MFEASYTTWIFLASLIRECLLSSSICLMVFYSMENMAEERAIVRSNIATMILLSMIRLAGVCLSLRAFLKSLMIELKAIEFVEFEEKLEGATDIWMMFYCGAKLASDARSLSEWIIPELLKFIWSL